ncbi:peptide chain release factor 3 [Alkalihalobacillus alcalophilus ATCC 27647 = CGMCC 1.3604]|uniref:Peptide chain release factor 3 n=1 Tax=Alkalihalobacillus alcalophilus ATCC 27647 = CGMCC 1.3604 TaxID=1218173 RepID=A0A094WKX8_ALKAL|nr:peptide chain release factor 3 [Alkalihalobacillus alcalophilus]KGA96598.1 peptide chain release factor 3 [Alkalihalobacillus alcalophilus ATCC 27647 = CGMCC 1.3604]MED1563767.1 peptide chain release factor 3 [Alkalihalobacillus alcalophilus]THG89353.1 peptide chain release factor 3 [Alkalihalobacillus alcalophilus ATCC 27647 = CGMCC 1.3604]
MTKMNEIESRRTFAIISHPDAGKTTLTEKLLLFGGAIREAGTVKGRKNSKHAMSDWMEIEKQRGISVTSSVLEFLYDGYHVNILDTPGHQDFSEDTYRTLTAADSATMLIDVAKGVEAQTKKLFKVCKMRGIPIFTFINKLDRQGRDPFDLMEELENLLGIRSYPMGWPIGMGQSFSGVYDRMEKKLELYNPDNPKAIDIIQLTGPDDPKLDEAINDEGLVAQFREELELLDVAGDDYDVEKVKNGELTPIFFGSAVSSFGVQTFLEHMLKLAPAPTPRMSTKGVVNPFEHQGFSGFIFKIQANMNPAHRDRIAFLRITSGKFERGMTVKHVRIGKNLKLAQPTQFLAQSRSLVEEAYAGDIIGLFDPGNLRIGDTLVTGEAFEFDEMPHFSPEHFCAITVKEALKHKSYEKGLHQLTEEGAIQLFKTFNSYVEKQIVGVVGVLQFEVLEHRLKNEYHVDIQLERLPYSFARWVNGPVKEMEKFKKAQRNLVTDRDERIVVLFENEFQMRTAMDKYPELRFYENSFVKEEK